jgi:hypothetical protein
LETLQSPLTRSAPLEFGDAMMMEIRQWPDVTPSPIQLPTFATTLATTATFALPAAPLDDAVGWVQDGRAGKPPRGAGAGLDGHDHQANISGMDNEVRALNHTGLMVDFG